MKAIILLISVLSLFLATGIVLGGETNYTRTYTCPADDKVTYDINIKDSVSSDGDVYKAHPSIVKGRTSKLKKIDWTTTSDKKHLVVNCIYYGGEQVWTMQMVTTKYKMTSATNCTAKDHKLTCVNMKK